tara:strand:- start:62070 stop:63935 length:1866 start_codon:yes stop_codon:yes gene_type:complete
MSKKIKLTTSQALIRFLKNQYVTRDGQEHQFIKGVWGIFGHGNVAGISQALLQDNEMPYYLCRNEQAMTHTAIAYSKAKFRNEAMACTASVGPGSTNMITGAATATINRIPLLLLPSDIFARRNVAPVLQQLEHPMSQDISVNDAFKPVSVYWDRINRPDQLTWSLLEVMRVLTSPSDTGAVTLCMPQDVQTEAFEYPAELFRKRIWSIPRTRPDINQLKTAVKLIQSSKKPFIIAGGGVLYSEATETLKHFVEKTGIPIGETQAGKGSLPYNHPFNLGSIGATGSSAANLTAEEADLVISVGTRLSDFTTSSKSQFQNPDVKFIHLNVNSMDAHKLSASPLLGDAKVTLNELDELLSGYKTDSDYNSTLESRKRDWMKEVDRVTNLTPNDEIQQPNVVKIVNENAGDDSVIICAAGSLPGDLHKLWKTINPGGYHMEYGYSCMGYEIAAGLGVKMAKPESHVIVMVGDGSYQMLSSELITAVQEGLNITVVLINNRGYGSIGSLSESVGSKGFGTNYKYRNQKSGFLDGDYLPMDFIKNAESYGVEVISPNTYKDIEQAMITSRNSTKTHVIVIDVDKTQRVPSYHSWWDVPVAETSTMEEVKQSRLDYEELSKKQKNYL